MTLLLLLQPEREIYHGSNAAQWRFDSPHVAAAGSPWPRSTLRDRGRRRTTKKQLVLEMAKCGNDAAGLQNSSSGQVAILRCTLCPDRNKARKSAVKANFDLPRDRVWCEDYPRK
jgi:hypothetical protein